MRQAAGTLLLPTPGQGLHDVTEEVTRWVDAQGLEEGLLTLFCRHTSCSLLIQENAAPAARRDLERWFARIAPEEEPPSRSPAHGGRSEGARFARTPLYEHDDEGPDDMPAHLRAAVTAVNLSIPLIAGRLALGTWQGIYLFEHRRAPHRRTLALHVIGE